MKIFRALYENDCSTTKTAEALNMTQPAVSQAIKEMEQYYGVELFDRVGRRLVITSAGRILLDYAMHISSLFDEAEKELRDWDRFGSLSVGATLTIGSLFLPRYVKVFYEKHPKIEVKGLVAPTNILEKKILSYELDLALIEGIAHDPAIISEEYMNDELTVVCPADGKFTKGQTISIEEFKSQNILVREVGSGTREIFERAAERAGFSVTPAWEAISTTALVNAVISGLGVAVIPYRIVSQLIEYGAVININVEGLDLNRKFYFIRHKDKHLTSSAKAFLQSCRDYNSECDYSTPYYI
ncbi:MAG: LysR family transcriptional regulator [Oscillospiraceae bacterium]|nr:LysR family transcriptional regulator [Oscillospiraceae bacterium]